MQAPLQERNDSDAVQTERARTTRQERRFADNRPAAVAQRELNEMANSSPRALQQRALSKAIHNNPRMVAQRHEMNVLFGGAIRPQGDGAMSDEPSPAQRQEKTNNTGLPNQLKSGIESLSGLSMDHVRVHYNSDKPAQLQAHAYAQGSDIHLAAGQEKHLSHEAWHVVQQAQGRVRPTLQMKATAVNDDSSLEKEADVMGAKAAQLVSDDDARTLVAEERGASVVTQRVAGVVQRQLIETNFGVFHDELYRLNNTDEVAGAEMLLSFRPKKAQIRSAKIGLTQSVKSYKNNTPHFFAAGQRERTVAAGLPGAGYKIDRIAGENNPIYGADALDGNLNLADTKTSSAPIGKTPHPEPGPDNNTHYVLGSSDGKQVKKAKLYDTPKLPKPLYSAGQEFESTALALEGLQSETYLGSVRWGWQSDNAGNVSLIPFQKVSDGDPSANFLAAAAKWNENSAPTLIEQETEDDDEKYFKTKADISTKLFGSSVQLAKGLLLRKTDAVVGGKTLWFIESPSIKFVNSSIIGWVPKFALKKTKLNEETETSNPAALSIQDDNAKSLRLVRGSRVRVSHFVDAEDESEPTVLVVAISGSIVNAGHVTIPVWLGPRETGGSAKLPDPNAPINIDEI